jgi:hypothetical protein
VLKTASKDLKNYKRMMQLRKYDWSFTKKFAPKQTQPICDAILKKSE